MGPGAGIGLNRRRTLRYALADMGASSPVLVVVCGGYELGWRSTRVKALVKALILTGVAVGVSIALASTARADVVEPQSAYQPASVGLLSEDAAAAAMPAPDTKPAAEEPKPEPSEIPATPAPEQQVVRRVQMPHSQPARTSAVLRFIDPFRVGFDHIGASLARVASACDVGLATGAGGPILVLAVLSMAIPFVRRRSSGIRRVTDEDVPELLYAWSGTPPG